MIDTPTLADGTNAVTLGTSDDAAAAAALSIMAWIIATSFAGGDEAVILCHSSSTGNVGPFKLQIQDGGTGLRFIIGTSVGGDDMITDGTAFATGTLYHVAGVYDGASMITYVNGLATTSAAKTGTVTSAPGTESRICGLDTGSGIRRKFNGQAADVRLYRRGLSANEMRTIYACRGHDGIALTRTHQWQFRAGAPGVVAAGAGVFKDSGNGVILNASPVASPIWRAEPLSQRRRYL